MMYGGSAGTVGAWALSLNNIVALFGLGIAVAGLIVQITFARRRDKREREAHAARMKSIKKQ